MLIRVSPKKVLVNYCLRKLNGMGLEGLMFVGKMADWAMMGPGSYVKSTGLVVFP